MRFLIALIAAVVSIVLVLVIVAALTLTSIPEKTLAVVTMVCFFAAPVVAFAIVYRVIPPGDATQRAVERRRRRAISRRIPEKALKIAQGGEGVWQTPTWRVTGGNTPTIEVVENGAWETVFQARFHPGAEGQWVPSRITKDVFSPDSVDARTIHSKKMGGRPARWEIVIYRSGPWEDELDDQVRAAEEAALARDRDRMGLT